MLSLYPSDTGISPINKNVLHGLEIQRGGTFFLIKENYEQTQLEPNNQKQVCEVKCALKKKQKLQQVK